MITDQETQMISPVLHLASCIIHLTSALTSVYCQPSSVIVSPESNSFTLPARLFLTAPELTPQKHHQWPNFAPFRVFTPALASEHFLLFISNIALRFVHECVTCQRLSTVICILLSAVCQRQWCVYWFHRQIWHSWSPAAIVRRRSGSHTFGK